MSNTFDKLSVLDSFIEEVNSYLPEIDANLERLAQSSDDMEALEETYRRTHTIGGSASMMDFSGLAHVAHGMEDILGDVSDKIATLDTPTLALLRRSLQRLYRLAAGIRTGMDEEAVIAEDDVDYTNYRMQMEAIARGQEFVAQQVPSEDATMTMSTSTPSIMSLDEMLESFRTPAPSTGEEPDWPEQLQASAVLENQPETVQQSWPEILPVPPAEPAPSFSALAALAQSGSSSQLAQPAQPAQIEEPGQPEQRDLPTQPTPAVRLPQPALPVQVVQPAQSAQFVQPVQPAQPAPTAQTAPVPLVYGSLAHVVEAMQQQARGVEEQASSLKRTLTQLRMAASLIESQRMEFKGFLDGSKDALDRMEDWAGKAMGLNLRNSPEQVRRFLPLSVMWVANSKLKKVLDALTQMAGNIELTDDQLRESIAQLQSSIEVCGDVVEQVQDDMPGAALRQDAGWTPWEMKPGSDASAMRERVTFERRGDMAALRAEIEARLRNELRQEYENRPMTLAARNELVQQIRAEVREEYAARRRLQESVAGADMQEETLQALEARLRDEIEIEVRSQFLSNLTGSASSPAPVLFAPSQGPMPAILPLPSISNQPPVVASLPPLPSSKQASTSAIMQDFGEEAADIFRQEAEEHLQTISMYVQQLEHTPHDLEPIQGIRRATHTLKGAAGMMGFRAIAELCHISEDLLDVVMEGSVDISPPVISLILDTAEALDVIVNGKEKNVESDTVVQSLRERYAALLGAQPALAQVVDEELDAELAADEASLLAEVGVKTTTGGMQESADLPQIGRGDLSVRVPLTKLDELVNLFGELLVNRSALEERLQRLVRLVADTGVSSNRLRDVGQRLESRFEAATLPSGRSVQVLPGQGNQNGFSSTRNGNGKAEPAHLAEFDELELDRYTEYHQLARGLSEGISDMTTLSNEMDAIIRDCESVFGRESRLSTTFQDRLMKARLVPLSTMIPRLYRTARAVALKQHKEFELVLEGQETEVDRTVIEEVAGPLLHLMRNAVNHAIETPELRVQQGKPAAGRITLTAAYEGNLVVITVRDDGTGINPERVRNSALAHGYIQHDQVLSESDLIELIFRPGFSTAEVLSEESGRGVGLDVVRDSVSRLRGSLEVESTPGKGTAFTMKFPTSLAIQNAMMVNVGERQYAIPTVMVESIGRLDNFKQSMFGGRPAIQVQNEFYPLMVLAQLLDLPVNPLDEKAPIVLVRTDRYRVALIVDNIKGRMDVVTKNLGPHLRHVYGIAGGTVMGNGRVVLVLELAELLAPQLQSSMLAATIPLAPSRPAAAPAATPANRTFSQGANETPAAPVATRSAASNATPAKPAVSTPVGKHVLIVDDSPSVRRVVGNMLKQNGWDVQLARDGVEALEVITRETPAAVLLDIEMPRMDGYELMATIRAQEQYRTLPLVVLTSRAATKHQQRAMQIGANAYVVKPYQDEELLNTLKSLVYGAAV